MCTTSTATVTGSPATETGLTLRWGICLIPEMPIARAPGVKRPCRSYARVALRGDFSLSSTLGLLRRASRRGDALHDE